MTTKGWWIKKRFKPRLVSFPPASAPNKIILEREEIFV